MSFQQQKQVTITIHEKKQALIWACDDGNPKSSSHNPPIFFIFEFVQNGRGR